MLGFERTTNSGRDLSWTARLSDVHQGLFPGIVGLPRQGDLAPNDGRFDIRLPSQHASRAQTTLRWSEAGDASAGWEYKVSGSWNQRQEFAPPHAHGWGPLPESDLSLALEEWSTFGEARHRGPHGSYGMQFEGQHVTTSGWEFLLPTHRRLRVSSMAESMLSNGTVAARLDLVYADQVGHSEPLYNASGEAVGADVRAVAFETLRPGGMLSWQIPLKVKDGSTSGTLAMVAYGRVPSNHEWGANGIHHGSFRFEQGNPNLQTEWAGEGRISLTNDSKPLGWRWSAQGFAAMHKGFISLTPSARFAPISHAGQIYEFRANDAFRTGLEAQGEPPLRVASDFDPRVDAGAMGPADRTGIAIHNSCSSPLDLGRSNPQRAFLEPQLQGLGTGDVDGQERGHYARRSLGGHHALSNHRKWTMVLGGAKCLQPRLA